MLAIIGETLPLAIAIAFSPLAIVAVVVLLLSSHPRASSIGFLLGWATGVGLIVVAGYLLASAVPEPGDSPRIVAPIVLAALGAASIGFAIQQWRSRPAPDDDVHLPGWIARIDELSIVRSTLFGVVLAASKPKNLILAFGAGVAAESAALVGTEALITLGLFLGFSSFSIAVPVAAYLVAGARITARLDALREWLVRNNSAMVGVILLFVGVVLVGAALSGFARG